MHAQYLVIDEISMIDAIKFDKIIARIKYINEQRKTDLKLILVGDPMQLPPVEKRCGYFFNASEYAEIHADAYHCKLTEVKRQDNTEFVHLLQRVRLGMRNPEDIKYIKSMEHNVVNEKEAAYLCALNKKVDAINATML